MGKYYDKFTNYFINASDELINELNSYKLNNITVYKEDKNGSYTNETDYIYTAPPYNHTWFSDLLPEDMKQFLGALRDPNEVSVNAAADDCTYINDLPSSTSIRVNENEYCPSVGYQQYGDCWSWSSTTQANCNYNQKATDYSSITYNTKFSKLYTDFVVIQVM